MSDWRRFAWSPRDGAIVEGTGLVEVVGASTATSAQIQDVHAVVRLLLSTAFRTA
jgi:hypothetical protein